MDEEIKKLKERLNTLDIYGDNIDMLYLNDELAGIEEDIENLMYDLMPDSPHEDFLKAVSKSILAIKRALDLYVEEDEWDRLFPDRHDPDFDEDSISIYGLCGDD